MRRGSPERPLPGFDVVRFAIGSPEDAFSRPRAEGSFYRILSPEAIHKGRLGFADGETGDQKMLGRIKHAIERLPEVLEVVYEPADIEPLGDDLWGLTRTITPQTRKYLQEERERLLDAASSPRRLAEVDLSLPLSAASVVLDGKELHGALDDVTLRFRKPEVALVTPNAPLRGYNR